MSRIYFHSPSDTKEIYGSERAWMGCLTRDVGIGLLATRFNATDLAKLLPKDAYPLKDLEPKLGNAIRFRDSLAIWLLSATNCFIVEDKEYNAWEILLNTCLAIGNDPLKLCARIHAQCEMHCYCEGGNRPWLANIIRKGIKCKLMRDEIKQWTDLANWLETRADEPVVTSYSVCEQFPSQFIAEYDDKDWYDLSFEKQWELSMKKLRVDGSELSPDNWEDFRFDHSKDVFWLWDQLKNV